MTTLDRIDSSATLADLAVRHAGASRVFHRHGLDFCCHGQVRLDEACRAQGIDPDALVAEVRQALAAAPPEPHMAEAPLPELIEHILERFHAAHREEVPRLLAMARKVEEVHAEKASVPRGLADHLAFMAGELEAHMQKEEQVLFPLLLSDAPHKGAMAGMPISVMEREHKDHGQNLARLRALATDFVPPEEACNTWRALYLGLAELERELMEHIHLENNVLFPRALQS